MAGEPWRGEVRAGLVERMLWVRLDDPEWLVTELDAPTICDDAGNCRGGT